jgi:phytoene dehydrogenase-like protein
MSRSFDTVVVGGGADGLVAATHLGRQGRKVLLVEAGDQLGGVFREMEFAPGFRAAPLAHDAGYVAPEVAHTLGANALVEEVPPNATLVAWSAGERLLLHRDVARTAHGLRSTSARDAERWPAFAKQVRDFTGFLAELYRAPPPQMRAASLREIFRLLKLGRKFRALGKADMIELMRTLPMSAADWLDDWFESAPLKGALAALAVADVARGPMSGGTAFTFLHRHVGAASGAIGERLRLRAGTTAVIAALAERARAAGVDIETNKAAARIIVHDDAVAGIRFASGEEVICRQVISSLDPHESLFELLDPAYLEVEQTHAIRQIRYRGVTTKILLALDGLPPAPVSLSGALVFAPSIKYVERAYDAVKYGHCSHEPVIELRFPSVTQANLAPAGKHVAVMHVQFTPYGSRESIADRAIALVEQSLPGFASRIRERSELTPQDIEAQFGLREGAVSQGEMMLDQILFMRPVAGLSTYAMPVRGYYLCGAGTHPGHGITGMSGWLAAMTALQN